MPVVVAVLRESAEGERRVALTPEVAKKLKARGAQIVLEKSAAASAYFADSAFADAEVVADGPAALAKADVLLRVQPPTVEEISHLKPGAIVIAHLQPHLGADRVKALRDRKITSFAMELLPRTTRAQAMDVLSSQAGVTGYKAVLIAAEHAPKFFPMLTTAAGTIRPSKVLIVGAGVAGLQAIATAKRLGAQVEGFDVRPETKEQIESLGAKAIFVENVAGIEGEGAGGYATEMSDEYKAAQAELVSSHIAKQDIVITTALIPGRAAPRLITDAQIKSMKPGSVIFDLAVAQGGNVEGSKADEVVVKHGVKILGYSNTPAHLAADTSALFARNLFNFLSAFWDKDAGRPVLPDDDEITAAIRLTKGGKVVNERLLG